MALSNEIIQKKAVNFLEYQKGRALYHRMQVMLQKEEESFANGTEIKGTVRDLSRQYEAEISVYRGEIRRSFCTCGEYDSVDGLCRHRIAVLLQYKKQKENLMEFAEQKVGTSPACFALLRAYERKERLSLSDEASSKRENNLLSAAKKLRVTPGLVWENRHFFMEFWIGCDRPYVIRDLVSFCRGFQNGDTMEFGKRLVFESTEAAYTEESLELIRLMCIQMEAYFRHKTTGSSSLAVYSEKKRVLELDESVADDYMELFFENAAQIPCRLADGREMELDLVREDPKPVVRMKAKEKNGAGIYLENGWGVVFGRKRIYLINQKTLYWCSDAFSRDLRDFFFYMQQKAYPTAGEMDIAGEQLPALKRFVFPFLESWLTVICEGIDMESYERPGFLVSFFLDMLEDGKLTLTCEGRYGSYSFNPATTDDIPDYILRDKAKERLVHDTLLAYFPYRDYKGVMMLEEEESLYLFLTYGIEELRRLGRVFMTDAVQNLQVRQAPKLQVRLSFVSDMLQIKFESEGFDAKELAGLLHSYEARKKYHRLSNGDIVRLENGILGIFQELEQSGILKEMEGEETTGVSLPAYRSMYLEHILDENGSLRVEKNDEFIKMVSRMKEAGLEIGEVPGSMEGVLRDYQKYGYLWMKTLQRYHFGGILADDMGLGKTVQVIALLLSDQAAERTSLIVCPASLIYNWQNELRTFAPSLSCLTLGGDQKERRRLLINYRDYDVVVTSYDLVRRDLEDYQDCHFYYEILDEAQYIKNSVTKISKAVKAISSDYRMALTGTPIENRLGELWSIFDFLMPGYLYSQHRFRLLFEQTDPVKREAALGSLREMTAPFLLRRKKKDVLKELPEKYETVIYSGLEGMQEKLYRAAFLELKEQLEKNGPNYCRENRMQVLAQLTRLRQICCDPSLCFEGYQGSSAKLETCLELLEQAVQGEHKILLFSQFTSMLDIVSRRLSALGMPHLMLTGSTSKEERMRLVNEFQTTDIPVFLISLKAGGTGLNLTAADLVIHYDPWWNIAAQNQATDRAHRIGQEKELTVYRLIAKNTLEESILRLQEEKGKLSEDILSADFTSLAALTGQDIEQLLR